MPDFPNQTAPLLNDISGRIEAVKSRILRFNVDIPPEDTVIIKRAYGREPKPLNEANRARAKTYFDQAHNWDRWFGCDCRPQAKQPPLLTPVQGDPSVLRRMTGEGRTPHSVTCPFFRDTDEHRSRKRDYERPGEPPNYKIHPNFSDGRPDEPTRPNNPDRTSRQARPDRLQRILWEWLSAAGLDTISLDEIDAAGEALRQSQMDRLDAVINSRNLREESRGASAIPLSDLVSFSPEDAGQFACHLRTKSWPDGFRPQGFLIGIVTEIRDHTLKFDDDHEIEIRGRLLVFGEPRDKTYRFPYLAIVSYAQVSRTNKYVDPVRAYLHPVLNNNRWFPVDSINERNTANSLVAAMDKFRKHGLSCNLIKPLFDMNPDDSEDAEVLLPDFVLDVHGPNVPAPLPLIVEVLGYDDKECYLPDKAAMIALMEAHALGDVIPVEAFERPKDARPGCRFDLDFLSKLYKRVGI